MAKTRLEFGDINTADISLRLMGTTGQEYGGNPVHLHSQVLQMSEFFKARLSDRWSTDTRPLELEVKTCWSFEKYLKCIHLMYSSFACGGTVCIHDVDECLEILSVASELLVDKYITECMQFLEAVHWSSEQESKIRSLLLSLQLKILPDLAERLDDHDQDNNYLDVMEESIKSMLPLSNRQQNNVEEVCKYLVNKLQGNTCADVADMCGRMLVEEFKLNIEKMKSWSKSMHQSPCPDAYSTMSKLVGMVEHNRRILEAAFNTICETQNTATVNT